MYQRVNSAEGFAAAGSLFKEYANWLGIDLSFQKFEAELTNLQHMYAAPLGGIILYEQDGKYVGCVAVRQQAPGIAEMKRMYVQPMYQHLGIGQGLLDASLELARELGYQKIRLDTLRHMTPALNLYLKNGFIEISAYYFNPEPETVYLEKVL